MERQDYGRLLHLERWYLNNMTTKHQEEVELRQTIWGKWEEVEGGGRGTLITKKQKTNNIITKRQGKAGLWQTTLFGC